MVVPIMVLLFLKKKSGEIADKPSEKGVFSKDLPIKKEVPYWGEHGTSTYWNTVIYSSYHFHPFLNQREIVKKRLLISCKYRICFLDVI